jgi:hypothetical protein
MYIILVLLLLTIIALFILNFYLPDRHYLNDNPKPNTRHTNITKHLSRLNLSHPNQSSCIPSPASANDEARLLSGKAVLLEYNSGDDLTYWEQIKPLFATDVNISIVRGQFADNDKFNYPMVSFVDMNMMNVDPPVSVSINTNRNFNHIRDRIINLGPKWNQVV